jgi:hypothetical protein
MSLRRFLGLGSSCLVALVCALATSSKAFATPTPIIKTTCIWVGDDGELLKQKCQIFGNSSAGSGTSFSLAWEDGMKTVIRANPNSRQFTTAESKRNVELHGTFEFSRMGLPRQIHIDGLGIIVVTYKNYSVSRDYEAFGK